MCTESKDITKKVSKIGLPNQTSKIWHILADISGLGEYSSKPSFALKPWVQAGRFEYREPHNRNNFFFTFKGSQSQTSEEIGGVLESLDLAEIFFVSLSYYS